MSELRDRIKTVLLSKDGEYDEPGDGWLWHSTPDIAHLETDALADALVAEIERRRP